MRTGLGVPGRKSVWAGLGLTRVGRSASHVAGLGSPGSEVAYGGPGHGAPWTTNGPQGLGSRSACVHGAPSAPTGLKGGDDSYSFAPRCSICMALEGSPMMVSRDGAVPQSLGADPMASRGSHALRWRWRGAKDGGLGLGGGTHGYGGERLMRARLLCSPGLRFGIRWV
jgi:hypothetical protein